MSSAISLRGPSRTRFPGGAVINAAISAFFYLKMVRAAYCQPEEEASPVRLGFPATILALFYTGSIILTGVLPQGLLTLAKQAVAGIR